jgi:cell division protein FtsL
MSKVSNAIAGLKSRLTIGDEGLIRMLPFAIWLSFLALISIYSSHRADQKVHDIDKLSDTRQTLEAEHTETREKLTKLSLESRVLSKAKAAGLISPNQRPEKIIVQK